MRCLHEYWLQGLFVKGAHGINGSGADVVYGVSGMYNEYAFRKG